MTVLAGYAPTENGRLVVAAALAEAQRRSCPLVIVNSATGSAYADRGLADEADLEQLQAQLDGSGVQARVQQVTQAVTASETLIRIAEELPADLLVIGLRQRTRTGKFLLGSISQDVLLNAPCDVLGVRLPF